MKNYNILNRSFVLFGIILIFNFTSEAFGQDKIFLVAGAGFPELLNVGISIPYNQTKVGITIGSVPLKDENIIAISGNLFYHFGKFSLLSSWRFWFVKFGLNYVRDEDEYSIGKYFNLVSRVGRDFNFSEKFGIEVSVGLIILLSHTYIEKNQTDVFSLDIAPPISPSIGMVLFYRI